MPADAYEEIPVGAEYGVRSLYELFCARQAASIQAMLDMKSLLNPAMDCAIFSYAYRAGCECLLQYRPETAEEN